MVVGIALETLMERRRRTGGGSPDPVRTKKMTEVRSEGEGEEDVGAGRT